MQQLILRVHQPRQVTSESVDENWNRVRKEWTPLRNIPQLREHDYVDLVNNNLSDAHCALNAVLAFQYRLYLQENSTFANITRQMRQYVTSYGPLQRPDSSSQRNNKSSRRSSDRREQRSSNNNYNNNRRRGHGNKNSSNTDKRNNNAKSSGTARNNSKSR